MCDLIQLTCLTLLTGAMLSDFSGGVATAKDQMIPIILDTDVGSAIDDAYALALLLAEDRCELLGVTTSAGQAADRAWMVCRFLTSMDRQDVPVVYRTTRGRSPRLIGRFNIGGIRRWSGIARSSRPANRQKN